MPNNWQIAMQCAMCLKNIKRWKMKYSIQRFHSGTSAGIAYRQNGDTAFWTSSQSVLMYINNEKTCFHTYMAKKVYSHSGSVYFKSVKR